MNSNMILTDILKGSEYSLILFKQDNINSLEERIITKMNKKGGEDAYVTCIVRNKEVKLTPEEVVRQLYAQELIENMVIQKNELLLNILSILVEKRSVRTLSLEIKMILMWLILLLRSKSQRQKMGVSN